MTKAEIMIVEDDFIIKNELKIVIESLGYQVTTMASKAEEAIKNAEELNPDVILMDIRLEGEMDGIEASEIIRSRFDIPIVFLTAHTEEEYLEKAKLNLPYGYLIKPIKERDLKIALTMALYAAKLEKERKTAEQDLKKLWMAVEQSPSSIVITNEDGIIEYINPGFSSMTGYSKEEAIGENPRILKSDQHDDSFYKEMWTTLASGKVWKGEICNRKKNGDLFWEQVSISPVIDEKSESKHYIGYIGVKEDITQKKELEHLKEDIELITRHDLKTPLNAIIGYPQVILMKENLSEKGKQHITAITEAGYRMLNMINMSLDLFKMEKGVYQLTPVPVDVLKVVKSIETEVEDTRKTKNVTIKTAISGCPLGEEDTFNVFGEELLCYSMLANLIKNAIEASPEGGVILISVDKTESAIIRIHNKGRVPEKICDKFFEKYTTSGKTSGTGLGTYSAKLIAETQQGKIDMVTSETEGTTITIQLPVK